MYLIFLEAVLVITHIFEMGLQFQVREKIPVSEMVVISNLERFILSLS